MTQPSDTPDALLREWDRRLIIAVEAHYESGRRFARRNLQLGVPSVVLAAVIATLAFAFIGSSHVWPSAVIGLLGTVQLVLSALHTWFRHAEIAEKHRQAGARYSAIRRQIEQTRAFGEVNGGIQPSIVNEIRNEIDTLSTESPNVPADIWQRAAAAHNGAVKPGSSLLSSEFSPAKQA